MTFHFNKEGVMALIASCLEANAWDSVHNGCRVVTLECFECGELFDEEIEAAKAAVFESTDPVCLACDIRSEEQPYVDERVVALVRSE